MIKTLDRRLEIKDVSPTGVFAGYGSVYGNIDQGDDVVAPGAFADSLAEWAGKGALPAMLWQHRSGEPIGAYTAMSEDSNGLIVEGKLALKTQRGAEAHELLQMKAISGLSVGFLTRDDSWDQKTGVRTIRKADLWEVSLVTFPMNDQARVSQVKSIEDLDDLKGVEAYLRDAGGFSRMEAKAMVARIKSLSLRDAGGDDEAKQLIESLARRAAILRAG